MKVTIELLAGRGIEPIKADVQTNIDAISKVLNGKPLSASDKQVLTDTKSILRSLQMKLPNTRH